MKILSEDTKNLNHFHELLEAHEEIKITELGKTKFDQSVIDNVFIEDFDGDGSITRADYRICANWLMQGKPQDIENYNKDRGYAPRAVRLPVSRISRIGQYSPNSSMILETEEDPILESSVDLTAEHTSDFDQDGRVSELDRDILAGYCLQGGYTRGPSTPSEYNLNRLTYPYAERVPNLVTANYTCNEGECCDDDYTGDGRLSSKDALVYYAWASMIDWDSKPDGVSDIEYYTEMAPPGFKFDNVKFPVMPCADFDADGVLSSNDALIYYAWSSRIDWSRKPLEWPLGSYYSTMAPLGFRFSMGHSPVCPPDSDVACSGTDEMCVDSSVDINWADFLIIYKWLVEDKCNTVECYNSRREDYPFACKIPFSLYESIGANIQQFDELKLGLENL
tara:strand:+ start:9633 stop:10811 length:1179 start_codon:yes stop_codon:yes gene_type:complete